MLTKKNCSIMGKYVLAFLILCGVVSCKMKSQKIPEGVFRNLGVQLKSSNMQAVSFATDSLGNDYAYFVVRGRPGHLIGYDLKSNRMIADIELSKHAEGAIEMAMSTDNWLYIGASNGHLLRTRPGSNTLTDLGKALEGTVEIMSLEAGSNGDIYGGTFPTGKVFKYNEKEGITDLVGQVVAGESYVQRVRFEEATNTLYAGIGSHAHLIRIDLNSLEKVNILPEEYAYREFVYYLGLVEGLKKGGKIFAWVTNATDREVLVFDSESNKLEHVVPSFDANVVAKSPFDNEVYFTAQGSLYRADFDKHSPTWTKLMACNEAKSMLWSKEGVLQILTKYGELKTFNPKNNEVTSRKIEVTPLPYGIQTIVTGPDGNIWSSGYLFGGNAVYNPKTDVSKQLQGVGQAEGMVVYKNSIHFGVYPKARFYEYNTLTDWLGNGSNPKYIGAVAGQDRPFASASIASRNKIYWGTIPGYGKLGGALIDYDVLDGTFKSYTEFLNNHAVASLLHDGRNLLVGTTIYGGLGAKPTEKEGRIVVWDMDKKEAISSFVPVPNLTAITYLGLAKDGKLWGFADATIFVYDMKKNELLKTIKLADIPANPSHIWRLGFLDFHPNGFIYGAATGKFFRIDPKSYELTVLKEGVGLITRDFDNNYYTRDVENLWKYTFTSQ